MGKKTGCWVALFFVGWGVFGNVGKIKGGSGAGVGNGVNGTVGNVRDGNLVGSSMDWTTLGCSDGLC